MSQRCRGCMELFGDEFEICPHCGYAVGTHAEEAIHIEPGTLLHDRYIVGKVLGYGGFGVTYIGWDGKLQQKVAIKEYLPGEFSTRMPGQSQVTVFNGDKSEQFRDGMKKFVEEAKHLAKFQNEPGIVKIFDSFEENETAYIVMEYLDGETLTDYLKRVGTVPEDDAVAMLTPLMQSLQAVHNEGMLHRDIAPDNIFLTKTGEVKLIDFGASRYATTSHSRSLTVIIKPGYSPEEQYRSRGDQGPHTDVYAVAATLYKMITGLTPPDAMERRAKYENENKDILVPLHKINKKISVQRENAILNAMNVRIEDRTPDIAGLLGELNADPPAKRRYGKIKKLDLYGWPLWIKITVPVLLAAIVTVGALMATGIIDFSRFSEEIIIPEGIVEIPDVEGLTRDEAITLLKNGGLLPATKGSVESEYVKAGKIILQDPIGGMYTHINSEVGLTISSGKSVDSPKDGMATVPHVIWDPLETAVEKLKKAGLGEPTIVMVNDDEVEADHIISQSVAEGETVAEGTVIELTVSMGAAAFDMPEVVQMNIEKAKQELEAKKLVVKIEYVKTDEYPEGTVIGQSIDPSTEIKRGTEVVLQVSSGTDIITVENVVGMEKKQAQQVLKDQGFQVSILENYDDSVPAGTVISQDPAAGSSQRPDSTIVVYISKGAKPQGVKVANVIGMSRRDAKSALEKQGFQVTVSEDYHESAASGTVYGQNPSGGASKTAGSTVTIYVSLGQPEKPVSVANVVGKSESSAVSTLKNQGFQVNVTSQYSSDVPEGIVISQDPPAGSSRYEGASVTIKVSKGKQPVQITLDPNGGSVGTTEKTVFLSGSYGELPAASRTGYTFEGWFTSADAGSQVNASSTVTNPSAHKLYAHWKQNLYTLTFVYNGGSGEPASKQLPYGSPYGDLPTPHKDYFDFVGWVNESGESVTSSNVMGAADASIAAVWKEKAASDWTDAGSVPADAEILDSKWTYTLTSTVKSRESSMAGYEKISEAWVETGRGGPTNYASFPYGFNQGHWIYQSFARSKPYSSNQTATTKREVSDNWGGYVYWHWMYNVAYHNVTNRAISDRKGHFNASGQSGSGYPYYCYFIAFTSGTNCPYLDNGFCCSRNQPSYNTSSIFPSDLKGQKGAGTPRCFRFEYRTASYIDYAKEFTYQKVEQMETPNEPTTGNISNVRHLVRYREK